MHSSGVPAMGQPLCSSSSLTACAAALRPPFSIASATGCSSSKAMPADSRSTSAEPLMFCTLFARYMAACSRAPSFPFFASRPSLPTITQPRITLDAPFLSFADFFPKELRRAEPEEEAITRDGLHGARFHLDLDGMARVGRNNSPTQLNTLGLAGDDGENCSRRAGLEGMFTPPRIGFSDPEGVETRALAGLSHSHGFGDGLHAGLT